MKKSTLALVTALSLLVASVAPVSAFFGGSTVTNYNKAVITNDITTTAITGANLQGNTVMVKMAGADDIGVAGNNMLVTGNAQATTKDITAANIQIGCGCTTNDNNEWFHHTTTMDTNKAYVTKTILTQVDTGDNQQGNGVSVEKAHVDDITVAGNNGLTTGTAIAKTKSITIVNTQWNGMMMP